MPTLHRLKREIPPRTRTTIELYLVVTEAMGRRKLTESALKLRQQLTQCFELRLGRTIVMKITHQTNLDAWRTFTVVHTVTA